MIINIMRINFTHNKPISVISYIIVRAVQIKKLLIVLFSLVQSHYFCVRSKYLLYYLFLLNTQCVC